MEDYLDQSPITHFLDLIGRPIDEGFYHYYEDLLPGIVYIKNSGKRFKILALKEGVDCTERDLADLSPTLRSSLVPLNNPKEFAKYLRDLASFIESKA